MLTVINNLREGHTRAKDAGVRRRHTGRTWVRREQDDRGKGSGRGRE